MSELAGKDQSGSKVGSPVTPFGLEFRPKSNVKGTFSRINGGKKFVSHMEYMNTLKSVPKNAVLFDVYAYTDIKKAPVLIGTLNLEGSLTPSTFGDQSLYFRHQKKADDYKLNPEHAKMTDKFKCPLNPLNWADSFLGKK